MSQISDYARKNKKEDKNKNAISQYRRKINVSLITINKKAISFLEIN